MPCVTWLHMGVSCKQTALVTRMYALLYFLTYNAEGSLALDGVARLAGPLRNCAVTAYAPTSGVAVWNSTTNASGFFNASLDLSNDDLYEVVVSHANACVDVYTTLTLPFQLSAAQPADLTTASVGYGSLTVLSYLNFTARLEQNATATSANVTLVRQATADLYGTFNISLATHDLEPMGLQPLAMLSSTNATDRALAVALLAADTQLGALVVLGAALLRAAATLAASSGTSGATSEPSSSLLARLVAAEGMRRLLLIGAQQHQLVNSSADSRNLTLGAPAAEVPPSPSAPPPPPAAADMIGGLYTVEVVRSILMTAAARGEVSIQSYAVNATAEVVAGVAFYAEVIKNVALQEVGGERTGLNPLNALITMTRLAAVQADAASKMAALLSSDPTALNTYVLGALPDRLSMAVVDVSVIHTSLGLPAPAAPMASTGATHLIGPLQGCSGQQDGIWTPSYEEFVTSSEGAFRLAAKGQSLVMVSSYRSCTDRLTNINLKISVSNLGPAANTVSVSPVSMMAQAFYTLEVSQRLATVTVAQQAAAFRALGLDLAAYNALMFPLIQANSSETPSPSAPSTDAPPPVPAPIDSTISQVFNLSHPLMGAVIAANAQLVGLVFASRAMFARSCGIAYDIEDAEDYHVFTATVTLYAAALEATRVGGVLNLTSDHQLDSVFGFVMSVCYFNSSKLEESGDGTLEDPTGTFLSGGSGSSVGAAAAGRHRRGLRGIRNAGLRQNSRRHLHDTRGPLGDVSRLPYADLLMRGVLGLEGLMSEREGLRKGSWVRQREAGQLQEGSDDGAAVAAPEQRQRRWLAVYIDHPDMANVYKKVSEVLSGMIAKLQAVQARSLAAAAAATYSNASSYNLTDLVVQSTQLGVVLQTSFYDSLVTIMSKNHTSGLSLLSAVQSFSLKFTGQALQTLLEQAYFNRTYVCSASGAQCWSLAPGPSPSSPSGDGSKEDSDMALKLGLGLGLGLSLALLVGFLAYRFNRKRQLTKTLVNNFKTGDMNSLKLRQPSATSGIQSNNRSLSGGRKGHIGGNIYPSIIPAVLGTDPTMARDYPVTRLPGPNGPASPDTTLGMNNTGASPATIGSSTAGTTAPHTGGAVGGTLNVSLPPSRFAAQPDAVGGGASFQPGVQQPPGAFGTPLRQQSQMPMALPPGSQPSPSHASTGYAAGGGNTSLGSSGYRTYPNSAFVFNMEGGVGGGGDAAMKPEPGMGSYTNLHTSDPNPLSPLQGGGGAGAAEAARNSNSATLHGVGPQPGLLPPASALGVARTASATAGLDSTSTGAAAGGAGAGSGALNASIRRRGGLPPLAPYTAVTNTAAPTATLSSSFRAIPVNSHFNSSLRGSPQQPQSATGGPRVSHEDGGATGSSTLVPRNGTASANISGAQGVGPTSPGTYLGVLYASASHS